MTTTFIQTNSIGGGTTGLFNFAASGDALIILPNVTLASTSNATINALAFIDVEIVVLGTLASNFPITLPTLSSFLVGAGGSYLCFEPNSGSAGLFMNGTGSLAQIDGTLSSQESIAILSDGGNNTVNVTGTVSGASGVFLGLNGASGDILLNSGRITASSVGEPTPRASTTRFSPKARTRRSPTSPGACLPRPHPRATVCASALAATAAS